MATIDSKEVITTILRNDGTYPGDPQCLAVHSYVNDGGKRTFHLAFNVFGWTGMLTSPNVHEPTLLWEREHGLTEAGKTLLEEARDGQR